MLWTALWLWACAAPPPLHGGGGAVQGAELHRVERPDVDTRAWVVRVAGGTELWMERDGHRWRHSDQGAPDRIALSDDGAHIAWVMSRSGLPSLVVSEARPDAPARPLTNVGLRPAKEGAPAGFVPPPLREGDLRFDGAYLRWTGPDGAVSARWDTP